jgi:hypothetical protein
VVLCGISGSFDPLSPAQRQITHALLTRAPLYSGRSPFTFDLHVLGTPPAFVLSQDQTLHLKPGCRALARPLFYKTGTHSLPSTQPDFQRTVSKLLAPTGATSSAGADTNQRAARRQGFFRRPPSVCDDLEKSRQRPTLPRGKPRSTIGAEGLNDRVRDGIGCFPFAMATGNRDGLKRVREEHAFCVDGKRLWVEARGQASRPISTG